MIGTIIGSLIAWETATSIGSIYERHKLYNQAVQESERSGKPILRIGMRRSFIEPPNGDYTLDIDPAVLKLDGGVQGDERDMPFEDKQFSVAFNEHTLEHLYKAEDVQKAVNECVRVADHAYIICPSPNSIISNMFNPTHHLRLWFDQENNTIKVTENRYNTGLGFNFAADYDYVNIGQHIITDKYISVIKIGDCYVL
jgi:hypothetical protein